MAKVPAKDVKLIPHRWAMHAMQALAQRDAELLTRVFQELTPHLPAHAIDTPVRMFARGAPLQFHDYGFFDASASVHGAPLTIDRVVEGDTLLLLALRRHDAACARALIECRASLDAANTLGETPLEMLFEAFAAIELTKRRKTDAASDQKTTGPPTAELAQYETLIGSIRDRLDVHHAEIKAHTEAELERLYAQHAPERLAKIDAQMADFVFRERELLRGVKRKYEEA